MIKKMSILFVAATVAVLAALAPTPAYAQGFFGGNSQTSSKCGDTKTEFIACDSETGLGTIGDLIRISLIVLSILIGAVAVGAIAYASIIYASARDEQTKVNEAKTIVRNVIIGLLLYGFTIAIINWLVPGSVIETPEPSPTTSPPAQTQGPAPTETP